MTRCLSDLLDALTCLAFGHAPPSWTLAVADSETPPARPVCPRCGRAVDPD